VRPADQVHYFGPLVHGENFEDDEAGIENIIEVDETFFRIASSKAYIVFGARVIFMS